MRIKTVYPTLSKYSRFFVKFHNIMKIVFVVAALGSVIVNLFVKGKPWSIVVVWSLITVWNLILSPNIFELNTISITVSLLFHVVVMLALIDFCLTINSWAYFVIPIVVFSTLIVAAVFFFIDIKEDMHNSMPVIWLIILSLVGMVVSIVVLNEHSWPVIVMGSISAVLLIVCIFFNKLFMLELKKRFHTK